MYITHLALNNLLRRQFSRRLIERRDIIDDTVLTYGVKPYSRAFEVTVEGYRFSAWFPMVEIIDIGTEMQFQYLLPFLSEEEANSAAAVIAQVELARLRSGIEAALANIENHLKGVISDGTGEEVIV